MDKASTDCRIQSQPAKLLTLSGSATNWANSASITAFLAASLPYTLPSTLLRKYSKTRSAGFNSGEYGGCSIHLTGTSPYACLAPMATCSIPDQNRQAIRGPLFDHWGNGSSLHILSPIPAQLVSQAINRQVQICPLPLIFDRLHNFHSARCPHPAHLSDQPYPHFIAPGQAGWVGAADCLELVS